MPPQVSHIRDAAGGYLTPGLSPEAAAARQRQNVAARDREITFCSRRPGERPQWQCVEGEAPEQVVARITRDLRGH